MKKPRRNVVHIMVVKLIQLIHFQLNSMIRMNKKKRKFSFVSLLTHCYVFFVFGVNKRKEKWINTEHTKKKEKYTASHLSTCHILNHCDYGANERYSRRILFRLCSITCGKSNVTSIRILFRCIEWVCSFIYNYCSSILACSSDKWTFNCRLESSFFCSTSWYTSCI